MQNIVRDCIAGRSVLCAVSGGLDSVVLLHLLRACGITVVAAHVEHGIRGDTSLRDCDFVRSLCETWNVPLVLAHLDVPAAAAAQGKGIEETARSLRYDFLRKQRVELQLDCIATAHHLNDQAETVLMHLIRGCSPAGLAGMEQERGGIVRPLLNVPREDIEAYARAHDLAWVEDETNADLHFTRNAVRHSVLPELEKLNPRIVEALGRLARLSQEQNGYSQKEAQKALALRLNGEQLSDVRDLHDALRHAVLAEYLARIGAETSFANVRRAEELFDLSAGRRATLTGAVLERGAAGVRPVKPAVQGDFPLQMGRNITPLGEFELSVIPRPDSLDLGRNAQALDPEKLTGDLYVTTRKDGDRAQLLGSRGHTLVSDILTDRKVPRALRDAVPLVKDGAGDILWIAGVAPCDKAKADKTARRLILIRYRAQEPSD